MPSLGNSNNLTVSISTEANTQGLTVAEEKIAAFQKAANDLAGALGGTTGEAEKTGAQVAAVGNESEKATPKGQGFAGAMGSIADSIRTVGGYIAGYQLIQFFRQFADLAFGGAGELEQTNMAFQSMVGNAQEANSVFGQLVQYANVTPFQSKDIESAARTLMGFGTAGQQTVDIIKQLGDVVSVGGGDMQALALVTGQIFAQGRLRAQDMYQVINDGGAGLVKIMAANVGGMQKLTDEFNNGGIPAKQYFDAINQATAAGGFAFQGADKQAQTLNGRLSTLKDAVQQFAMKLLGVKIDPQLGLVIQPGGLFDKAKGIVEGLSNVLTTLGNNQTAIAAVSGAIVALAAAFVVIGAVMIGPILLIVPMFMAIGAYIGALVSKFKELPLPIALLAGALFGIVGLVAVVAAEVITHWQQIKDFFGTVVSDLGKAWNGFTKHLGDAVKSAAKDIEDTWHKFTDTLGRAWNATLKGITDALGYFKDHFFEIIGFIIVFVLTLPIKIIAAFVIMGAQLASLLAQVLANVLLTFANVLASLASIDWGKVFIALATAFSNVMGMVWNAVTGAFTGIINWLSSINWGNVFGNILAAIGHVKDGIFDAIGHAFDWFTHLDWGKIVINVGKGIANAIIDLINGAIKGAFSGVPGLQDHIPQIPHFATGVSNFGGGLALVGENGPELISLPRGASVYTAAQTAAKAPMSTGRQVTVHQTNHIYNPFDMDIAARELGFRLAHA